MFIIKKILILGCVVLVLLIALAIPFSMHQSFFLDEPLLSAAAEGNNADVFSLLHRGADINAREEDSGMTPLMYATANDHDTTVQLLLSKGAVIHLRDDEGQTALSHAKGNKTMTEILKKADLN
jgi:hypothetical protein